MTGPIDSGRPLSGIGQPGPAARVVRSDGRRFGEAMAAVDRGAPSEAAGAPHAAEEVGLAGLLALQEGETQSVQDRNARRHGKQLLDQLVRLQHALLGGASDPDDLAALARLHGERPPGH